MVASYPLLSQAPTPVEVELGCEKNVARFGSSLSKSLDCRKFAFDTNTNLKFVKTFGIQKEEDQFYPNQNLLILSPKCGGRHTRCDSTTSWQY